MERRRKINPMIENDRQYIEGVLLESTDSEISEAVESDDGGEEFIEDQLQNSDVEKESEEESGQEEEVAGKNIVLGKDQVTKWELEASVRSVKIRSHNILTEKPGVKGRAKASKTVFECWNNFISDNILALIVEKTNKLIAARKADYCRERDCTPTDIGEIRAFIGLLYMAGVLRNSKLNTSDLWNNDGTGVEIFRTVMSQKRFHFLLQYVRFDDKETRNERKAVDKLAPIREAFEFFVENCQECYSLNDCVTIDEMLAKFRGRCARQRDGSFVRRVKKIFKRLVRRKNFLQRRSGAKGLINE